MTKNATKKQYRNIGAKGQSHALSSPYYASDGENRLRRFFFSGVDYNLTSKTSAVLRFDASKKNRDCGTA